MRGEVLHYDVANGFGFITGEDGNRYTFRREDLRRAFTLSRGTAVEFSQTGDRARDVAPPLTSTQVSAPPAADGPWTPAAAAAAPIATPAAPPAPQRYGRNATGDGTIEMQASTGLWGYFLACITTNYANFSGRARRKEYWGFGLFYILGIILLTIVGGAIDAAAGNFDYGSEAPFATIVIVSLALLASLVPGIALSVRRLHDLGLSGWFYLLMFVVGFVLTGSLFIMAIVLGAIPSQKRENQWGPVPEGVEAPQAS